MDNKDSLVLPLIIVGMMTFSVVITYYSILLQKDYEVLFTEDGVPDIEAE